jgi:hypothetical protein
MAIRNRGAHTAGVGVGRAQGQAQGAFRTTSQPQGAYLVLVMKYNDSYINTDVILLSEMVVACHAEVSPAFRRSTNP